MRSLPAETQDHTWHPLLAARLVILAAFLDLFLQFPVVAPYARSLGASATTVGIVVAAYSATNLIGNLVAGVVLDRWGRRLPILGGLLGTATALLVYVFTRAPQQLILARAVHGLTAASLTPGAFAILGDSATPNRRARVMGVSGAIISIAAVVGPSIAGILGTRAGFQAVFLLSATLMLATSAGFWWLTRKQVLANPVPQSLNSQATTGFLRLVRRPRLIVAYLAALALTVGLGTLVAHLPITLMVRGESPARSGIAFTIFAVLATLAMASPLNRISDRCGRIGPMRAGLALIGVGLVLLGSFSASTAGIVVGMSVFGLGFGVLFPPMTALVTEAAAPNERGKAFGMFYAVYSLGVVIGSVTSGLLADYLGDMTGVPFWLRAAVALVAILAVSIGWRMHREDLKGS